MRRILQQVSMVAVRLENPFGSEQNEASVI
jgi:predicted membrane chloride channel (bestrophin family)